MSLKTSQKFVGTDVLGEHEPKRYVQHEHERHNLWPGHLHDKQLYDEVRAGFTD